MTRRINSLLNKIENRELMETLRDHDMTSYLHSCNVAETAEMLMPFFQFENTDTELIIEGALLHDVGKIYVPSEILQKKEELTEMEMTIIKQHPVYGNRLLENRNIIIRNICLLHHERLDGSGYPKGIPGEMIPDYCRYITSLDILEALSSDRPYKQAMNKEQILEEIKKMSTGINLDMTYFSRIKELMMGSSSLFSKNR